MVKHVLCEWVTEPPQYKIFNLGTKVLYEYHYKITSFPSVRVRSSLANRSEYIVGPTFVT